MEHGRVDIDDNLVPRMLRRVLSLPKGSPAEMRSFCEELLSLHLMHDFTEYLNHQPKLEHLHDLAIAYRDFGPTAKIDGNDVSHEMQILSKELLRMCCGSTKD